MAKKTIIKHTRGNFIQFKIPLLVRTTITDYRGVNDTDNAIDLNSPVVVEFKAGTRCVKKTATMVNNVAVVEDNGTLPVGAYNIVIKWRDANSRPMSYMQRTILEVVESSEAGGKYNTDEFDVVAYYPVIRGMRSAVVVTDTEVTVEVGGMIGADDDEDNEATVYNDYGEGSVVENEDEVTIYI